MPAKLGNDKQSAEYRKSNRYFFAVSFQLTPCSIVREPSPILFGALHLTMNDHFDMDEIFHLLISSDNSAVSTFPSIKDCVSQACRQTSRIVPSHMILVAKALSFSALTTILS